jgi:hypothetical protein
MFKKVLRYMFLFVFIYLAIVGGEVIGEDLMGEFDENTLGRAYKVGLALVTLIFVYFFVDKQWTKRTKDGELPSQLRKN